MENQSLYQYLLMLGDNSMILGHRLSELCGHGPSLETDIALTNISLDLFGQVRSYFQYAAKLKGGDTTEDKIAFLRNEREHFNTILVEQKNIDFAYVIARQFLFDVYHKILLEQLMESKDATISAIAHKSIKESRYHLRFSSEWVKRLGDGTEESHNRMQKAMDDLIPFAHELYKETAIEKEMKEAGIGADLLKIGQSYWPQVDSVLSAATIHRTDAPDRMVTGKVGMHSELLGFILNDFQYMQRAYPEMQW